MARSTKHTSIERRQLERIIAGLSEGVILIEPDQTSRWANQAALGMHGVSSIDALGRTVSEYRKRFQLRYRNKHALRSGAYPLERVVAGEEFSDVIVEVARANESEPRWVHRVKSLVITDDAGDPDTLVLILHDATDWASAEERFERAFGANPAPALICCLEDLRFIKVNQGFIDMTGYERSQILGKSVYELDVLEGAADRASAIEKLTLGKTISQLEAVIRLPQGSEKLVIVAGQPIEVSDNPCMLFTFIDLEPRRKAEAALKKSEEQFAIAFRMAPVPIVLCARDGLVILEANEALLSLTGFSLEELLGCDLLTSPLCAHTIFQGRFNPDTLLDGVNSARNAEIPIRSKSGVTFHCLLSAESVSTSGRDCVLIVLQDNTERRRTEQDLIAAIEAVMQDASWFSRSIVDKLERLQPDASEKDGEVDLSVLTPRERDVLHLLCDGLSDKEIAAKLGVATNTVRNRVSSLYSKLGLHRRSEVILWARKRGVLQHQTHANSKSHPASRRNSG
ncbi:helix-turn-helix transcriptional regulator [Caballeronia glebae]|uniref:helix-turn-helix transcriptional regulator n=1 Tax=Caballeronia glebae TaxID=1777143 RepID=UPI0038BCF467